MKTIVRHIEEDFSIVGQDGIYPTQFILEASNLSPIGESEWVEETTGEIFFRSFNNGPIEVIVDGIRYQSVMMYDLPKIDTNEEFDDCVAEQKGKLAFYLCGVKNDHIDDKIILGKGFESVHKFPDRKFFVVKNILSPKDDSKVIGFCCMTENGFSCNEYFATYMFGPEAKNYLLGIRTKGLR